MPHKMNRLFAMVYRNSGSFLFVPAGQSCERVRLEWKFAVRLPFSLSRSNRTTVHEATEGIVPEERDVRIERTGVLVGNCENNPEELLRS